MGIAMLAEVLPPEMVASLRADWWAPPKAWLLAEADAYLR